MLNCIGIRKETKDKTQRRVPLSPAQVRELITRHKIKVIVEPWEQRIFKDSEYKKAGATLSTDLQPCNIIFGVKEVAPELMLDGHAYVFFSHTIKGQQYNMPMLKHILDRKVTLFDYELVKGTNGKRLIFFGDFAGYAGMIDSMWAYGQRLLAEGIKNPFTPIKYATKYASLADAETTFQHVGKTIWKQGLPRQCVPFICGFTGSGQVATAAQQLFDKFPVVEIQPRNLLKFYAAGRFSDRVLYRVHFEKPDLYQHIVPHQPFDAKEFKLHPERYASRFELFLPMLSMLVNGIYWEPEFPRLITKKFMRLLYKKEKKPKLKVIGDITCDIDGSIELTVKETNSTNPVFVYEPLTGSVRDGFKGKGPVVLAVDKLPAELPKESSESFGRALMPFVAGLAAARYDKPIDAVRIPKEFKDAAIAYRGKLRPRFKSLQKLLP